jgi:hypothetical protein
VKISEAAKITEKRTRHTIAGEIVGTAKLIQKSAVY